MEVGLLKNLIKAVFALCLVSCLSGLSMAENYSIPLDRAGQVPGDVNLIGGDVFVATGLAAVGSTTPVILYGYSVSSDAVTNFALLRDSATLNTSSNIKLTLYPDGYQTAATQTLTVRLPIPVIFRNGLSINLNSAVSPGSATKPRWMFFVRYLREGAVPGKSPSQVDPRITVDNVGVN